MALTDPKVDLESMALFALLVAFSSATQDIALDAYRIEAVDRDLQGAMAATYQLGYRLAVLMAGAGALYIAEYASWFAAYATMASLTAVGIVTVLIVREPDIVRDTEAYKREARVVAFLEKTSAMPAALSGAIAWFIGAVVCPFLDFFARKGSIAIVILIFITLFRVSDITLGSMATKFYFDVGFTKTEVANITKIFGFVMTILGAFTGGTIVARFGIMRPMLAAAILISIGSLSFALLALAGHDLGLLAGGHQPRQFRGRHRRLGVHRLSVEPDQRAIHGDAIRAVQLAHDPDRQDHRRLLGRRRRESRARRPGRAKS